MKGLILGLLVLAAGTVHAETITLQDPKEPLEVYGYLGASYLCSTSEIISSTEEKFKYRQINEHYQDKRHKMDLTVSTSFSVEVAQEKHGLTYNPTSKACKHLFKLR